MGLIHNVFNCNHLYNLIGASRGLPRLSRSESCNKYLLRSLYQKKFVILVVYEKLISRRIRYLQEIPSS